ncbi:hypothetical protein [Palleronia abyssalis]|uniref:Uncharacterized protein n=1 Tax=Palleronia abyssalis TaxID=1501240 RepID=A0A2R8C1A3_9RHOB|nr:hypothetical protein [Palleronia abyssalis]SPJ26193.1 hypothetical protein PAA8504_04049 [Palleronia abyssalis]
MIGIRLIRRGATPGAESEVGMLDVSANALAVLILATMLVISAAAPPVPQGEVRRDEIPDLFYPSPIDAVLAPHSRYVFILPSGLVELDLDAFAATLADGEITAKTAQGELTLVTDRRSYRDLNDYRASLSPAWSALADAATPLDQGEAAQKEADTAAALFDDAGIATTYLVAAETLEAFSPLYWMLREARVPIRWVTVTTGRNVVFQRRVEDFERRGRQWQR